MPPDMQHLNFALWSAGANWLAWRADFDFAGPAEQLPVLVDPGRFKRFVKEYGVLRGVPSAGRENARALLLVPPLFGDALAAGAEGIDRLATDLSFDLHGKQTAFFSKLAAFAQPGRFVAYDRFARRGLARATGRPDGSYDGSYRNYSIDIDLSWRGELGKQIRSFLRGRAAPVNSGGNAFGRRVLDAYLMVKGGRWPNVA
ncbi:MAG: hypothetical protein Q8N31_15915 [Reyranella sp.]|nr:hypothetical protein [Reyranella sp.]MDP3161505.1 hypothetical protein [Reyranella sp.]